MSLERLLATDAVIACVQAIACGADAHDWEQVAACFDEKVLVDYVSLAGGEPVVLIPEQIVEAWAGLLPGFETTAHRLGNFRVQWEGERAVCRSYLDALHVIPGAKGGEIWRLAGEYVHRLALRDAGWKVTEMRFVKTWAGGNHYLPELAEARLCPRVLEVSFDCAGSSLAADLYLPGGWDEDNSLAAVLVVGSWLSVKEREPRTYALEMARKGFAALAFDHRGFGQSGGVLRACESPESKIAECEAALAFLGNRPEIDFERLFGLGLGAGAGYLLNAAARNARLKGLALAAPWLHEPDALAAPYGGADTVDRLTREGLEAQRAYEARGTQTYAPLAQAMANPFMAAELGGCRELLPNGPQEDERFALMSWAEWFAFNPLACARSVDVPVLLLPIRDGVWSQGARNCFDRLGGPKTIFWVDATPSAFYLSPALRTFAVRRISDFLRSISG